MGNKFAISCKIAYNVITWMTLTRFAVCISSWLPVLKTGLAGREIAYDKTFIEPDYVLHV